MVKDKDMLFQRPNSAKESSVFPKEFNAREPTSVSWFDCWKKMIKVKAAQVMWPKKNSISGSISEI